MDIATSTSYNTNIFSYSVFDDKIGIFLLNIDRDSILGKDIKNMIYDIKTSSYFLSNSSIPYVFGSSNNKTKIDLKEIIIEFYNKYCNGGDKTIRDDVYYHINGKRNNYKFFTLSRDIDKSARKINSKYPNREKKIATYDSISKDPEMIENYYSSKYGISNKDNIVAMFTEDDIMCLKCGCISDERLSDVPDRELHLRRFKCPKCGNENHPIATFDKYLSKLTTIYRERNNN